MEKDRVAIFSRVGIFLVAFLMGVVVYFESVQITRAYCYVCNTTLKRCEYNPDPFCDPPDSECSTNVDCGGCEASCSCSANTCTGDTCSNGCGGSCAGSKDCCACSGGGTKCENSQVYSCDGCNWDPSGVTCPYGCSSTTGNCANPNYCIDIDCGGYVGKDGEWIGVCEGGNTEVWCWESQFMAEFFNYTSPWSTSCVFNDSCTAGQCHPATDYCGGTANCSAYPGTVSHVDSCGGVSCGAPCSGGTGSCASTAPTAPSLISPTSGTVLTNYSSVTLTWNAPSTWGSNCTGNVDQYHVCVSTVNGGTCDVVDVYAAGNVVTYTYTPTRERTEYWRVAASNGATETWSGWWSFNAKVNPNCSNLTGPLQPKVGVASSYSASVFSPMGSLRGVIFKTDLTAANRLGDTSFGGYTGTLVANWTPTLTDVGNNTIHCRVWNDGRAECRPPVFVDSWPRVSCAGPGYSLNVCVEGYTAANLGGWTPWAPACGVQTRTRTCFETCGTDDCTAAGTTQTQCATCAPTISAWSTCSPLTHKRTRTCVDTDGACGGDDCAGVTLSEDCVGLIQGNLYDASDCAPGECSCAGSSPIASAIFSVAGDYSEAFSPNPNTNMTTDGGGSYSFNSFLKSGINSFTFDFSNLVTQGLIGDATPRAFCPSATPTLLGCDTGYAGASPCRTGTFDFGFYRSYDAWWQAKGGKVHAETNVTSVIPASVASANQRLILGDVNSRDGIVTYGNSLSLGTNPNAYVSTSNRSFKQGYQGQVYSYEYFKAKYNSKTTATWSSDTTPPAYVANGEDGDNVMLVRYTGALPMTLSAFNVTNGQKYVVLVPGNVNVSGNITVASGGSFILIASGDINFGASVGTAEGWYVANGTINIESTGDKATEKQFKGNGSFVGWDGFTLNRDLGSLNNTTPAELFTFRGDLMENAPLLIKFPFRYYLPYNP